MKRKLLAIILIIVLALSVCAIFASCDNDNATGYKFSDDMSREEIIEAINSLDNFTYEYYLNDELDQVHYIGNSFYGCWNYRVGRYDLSFIEGNRIYNIYYANIDVDGNFSNEEIKIYDFTGYDTSDLCSETKIYMRNIIRYQFLSWIEGGEEYTIEDGNLCFSWSDSRRTWEDKIKDCNVTTFLLPEKYANYADMDATEELITYDQYDGYYKISINSYISSYEVPESYNGLPICIDTSCLTMRGITLPENIKLKSSIKDNSGYSKSTTHIIYKGTKAQWEQIQYAVEWCENTQITVTCSDGDYVVNAE